MIEAFDMKDMRDFVGVAMEMSYRSSERIGIGKLARWSVTACWESEDDGFTYLISRGWVGKNSDSTRVRVLEGSGPARLLTTYDLDFPCERIDVYHSMIQGSRIRDVLQIEIMQRIERAVGLEVMRPEEGEVLQAELIRGAAGKYRVAA